MNNIDVKKSLKFLSKYQNFLLLIINNENNKLKDKNIKSGLFNVSDDYSFSTNELIRLMYKFRNKKPVILKIPKFLIKISVSIGDLLKLPLNSQSFSKLTESYEVSNKKIKKNLGIKNMPLSFEDGLKLTLRNFN